MNSLCQFSSIVDVVVVVVEVVVVVVVVDVGSSTFAASGSPTKVKPSSQV